MHQVFAITRVYQLAHIQKLPKHAKATGVRIFGESRYREILADDDPDLPDRERLLNLAFKVLHTSQWYDDPNDRIRTMSNMELCSIAYVDERMGTWDRWPIWVADRKDATKPVGVEQHFDVILEYSDGKLIRFIGTIDGLLHDENFERRLTLDENKTASRLDDAWKGTFELGHQLTGYMACCIAVFGVQVWNARVTGVRIKQSNTGEDITTIYPARTPSMVLQWARWVRHTVDMHEQYRNPNGLPDFEASPRYTHSCNRYFRPCALIPFCASEPEDRIEQWNEMVETPLSPSERAVETG